jgi:hypothetical protein
MSKLSRLKDDLMLVGVLLAPLILIGAILWWEAFAPCWCHRADSVRNVPARCLKELQ